MAQVIKISQAGFNVLTATGQQLVLDSGRYGSLKISTTYTLTVNFPGGNTQTETTQAHGLGYVPAYLGVISSSLVGGTTYFPAPLADPSNFAVTARLRASSTSIIARVGSNFAGSSAATYLFKVIVFKEKIN